MRLSVVICTYNRCQLLDQTLTQMQRLRVPAGVSWELVIVNNCCSDETDFVIEKHAKVLPIRRIFELLAGLSRARNKALEVVTGDYVLWTDDDVLVDEGWLEAYCRAFERWPDAAVFGGRVEPWLEGQPPRWLEAVLPRVGFAFATINLGDEPEPLTMERLPFGANMAVRMAEQQRHRFDPDLGVTPKRRMGGEETAMLQSILADGGRGWWVPDARVRHFIPRKRQSLRYLRSYYFGAGQFLGRQQIDPKVPTWFGKPRWAWRRALESELRFRMMRFLSRPEKWVEDLIKASMAWGILKGSSAGL